jgi:hypothetical protein
MVEVVVENMVLMDQVAQMEIVELVGIGKIPQ